MSESGFPANPFIDPATKAAALAAPRVTLWSSGAVIPPAIANAAASMEIDVQAREISQLVDPLTFAVADCHWVILDTDHSSISVDAAIRRADGDMASLVVEASDTSIDAVWAHFGQRPDTRIMLDPDAAECAVALAESLARRPASLASPMVDDQRARQLAMLQEEVQRISRLLARLTSQDMTPGGLFPGNASAPASPFIEPAPPINGRLGAAGRQYEAQPDLNINVHAAGSSVNAQTVRRVIRLRRMRDELFAAELFADPAWDMMLDLFAARLERKRVSVSSLCIAAAVPATTALRWIRTMTDTGLFIRDADPHDKRRIYVALSDECAARMQEYFSRIIVT